MMDSLEPTEASPTRPLNPPTSDDVRIIHDESCTERYKIRCVLAKGGLGQICLAYDERLQRDVALKQIRGKWDDRKDVEEQFLLEALVNARLEHPGIVPVHDLGHDEHGKPFYCMKLLGGKTLRDEMRGLNELPAGLDREDKKRQLYGAFLAVCNAVAYAHSRGVLHLDLKPENVLLGEYGETQLLDWGLASLRSDESGSNQGRELTGAVGTPRYMAPEQLAGQEQKLSPATDLYALGVMLTELALLDAGSCLARDFPSDRNKGPVEIRSIIEKRLRGPVRSICRKALAEDARLRYQDARELCREVERYLAGEKVHVHREGPLPKLRRFARKRKTLLWAMVVGSMVLAGWALDRYVRHAGGIRFAQASLEESLKDWKQGRRQRALQRIELAAEGLRSDRFAGSMTQELARHQVALEAWLKFERALDQARYYSIDPKRSTETLRHSQKAFESATVPLTDLFRTDRTNQERQEALTELRLLNSWYEPTEEDPIPEFDETGNHVAYRSYLEGRTHHQAGRLEEAADAYERCLAEEPDHFWAMFFLATCRARLGSPEIAQIGYTACIARRPDLPFLYINRGHAYEAQGRTELALQAFEDAIQIDSASIDSRLHRARVLRRLDRVAEARRELDRILGETPHSAEAFEERALLNWESKDYSKATSDAEQASRLDPDLPTPYWILGLTHAVAKEWERAEEAYSLALARDPSNVRVRNNRASALLELQRLAEAKAELDRVLEIFPDYSLALFNRAVTSIGLGEMERVVQDLWAVPLPQSDEEAFEQMENFARIANLAGGKLPAEANKSITRVCVDRIGKLATGRHEKLRQRLDHLPQLQTLLREESALGKVFPTK